MTDTNHRHDDRETDNPADLNRITPRAVDPEHRDTVGGASSDPSTADDSGRSLRREPLVEEAGGGDIAGVAGGGIDDGVSGLGGDRNRR